ncbi:acyltransferase family protein [Glaciecola sp. 1036]|uniref:acyltransferase family protein n=1 Tax=Alteromonadaceae TaxID=72275 RepID=UPI003CFC9915
MLRERIYYLDLLRALAIMLVFTGHSVFALNGTLLAPLAFGGTGVDLFFLLSGWLIGYQLFAEQKKFGDINLVKFWIRRWMRTMPAYFAVLAATLTQLYLSKNTVENPLPYFLFIQNYYVPLPYFSISWSLALEEQFYLFIAPLILLTSRLSSKHLQLIILLCLLISPSVFRYFNLYGSLAETHVRWDCCIMGIILANLHANFQNLWNRIKSWASALLVIAILAYAVCYLFRWFPPVENYSDPSKLILAVIFACMVIYAVVNPVQKLPFAHKSIMHISTRSYSIYLLHPDAFAIAKKLVSPTDWIPFYLLSFLIVLIMAEILYRFVEITFINLREKIPVSSKRELPTYA